MPATKPVEAGSNPALSRALGDAGEKEYRRLLRVVGIARDEFFLFPVETDFTPALREALLARLGADLSAAGMRLRVGRLTREEWDLLALPEMAAPFAVTDVVALVGLEETPGILPEAGAPPRRPPALALLNTCREALHRQIPVPFLTLCPPYAFSALQEHAPDFFDHYAGLFRFFNAAPEPPPRKIGSEILLPGEREAWRTGSAAAVAFYEAQLAERKVPTPERAAALIGLAASLWGLREAHVSDRLQCALSAAEEALSLLSMDQEPELWAQAQVTLGLLFSDWSSGDREANLQREIDCYHAALRVFTEAKFPEDWAKTQNNLGNAYAELPSGNREANLRQAIKCFQAALRVRTEAEFPAEWATTQYNLGNVYAELPDDRKANLRQAICCYEVALQVLTLAEFPEDWAAAQNNLGAAYAELPNGDREANLRRAMGCFEAALRVYKEAEFPQEFALTTSNAGLLNMLRGNVDVARCYLQNAQRVFRNIGDEQSAQRVARWLLPIRQPGTGAALAGANLDSA